MSKSLSNKSKLPLTAIIIGIVSLFSDLSTEMAYPLLPLFISTLPGASPIYLGLIEGIAEATASLITGFSGWISDWFQKRKVIAVLGYGMTTIAKPVVALATGIPMVMLGRFMDRFGKGIRSAPKDTILANVATQENRGQVFGFERMMDSAGAVLGPACAILLFYQFNLSLQTIFLLTVIPSILAFGCILWVHEPEVQTNKKRTFSLKGLSKEFWIFLVINAVFNIGNSTNAFLILKASDELKMGVVASLGCYMLYNAVYSIGSYPAGVISDRLGRKNILLVGFIIFALVYFGFAQAQSAFWIWVLFAIYGIYPALTDGVGKAMAVDLTTPEVRATAIGLFAASLGLTRIPASYFGGVLWEKYGSSSTFYFGAIAALIAFILLLGFNPRETKA
ncbi:MAG: major facilitator superfamily protein [bacterium]|nr:MAG: major facilitator superfamily protein [bacterium]